MIFNINNLFKVLGILLILMSFTVFANAQTFNLNCNNAFNCQIKDECQLNGLFALIQMHSSSSYNVSSNSIGEHACNATINLTAFGQGNSAVHQDNEVTSVYLNGALIGTTQDKYANTGDPQGLTFCGVDTQTLGTKIVNLSQNNVVTLSSADSHGIISVNIHCTPTGAPTCEFNAKPRIRNLINKEIPYNNNFTIDLWNHVSDPDNRLSELHLEASTNNDILNCDLKENRYLECSSSLLLGTTTISVSATDPCKNKVTENFDVLVKNNSPSINILDQTKSCVGNLNKFLDLRKYSYDEEINLVDFEIISQSNTDLINCFVEDDYFLSCNINNCSEDKSELNISITDRFNETNATNFSIKLMNFAPTTKPIPSICISESENNLIDLRNYFDDLEDGNNLTFNLSQDSTKNIDCRISNSNFVSCVLKTNSFTTNIINIVAEDSGGKKVENNFEIKTNCSDNFSFSAPKLGICLEKCTSFTTQIELENKTNEKKYFSFDLYYNNHFEVSLGKNNFWLSAGQKITIPLSAMSCSNDNETYEVLVRDFDNDISLTFNYEVGECNNFGGFRLIEHENKVCKGERAEFSVDVTNTTNELKIINLTAENQLLLPYFSKERVILDSQTSETVQVKVNAKHAPLGKHNIFLGGSADNYHIQKRMIIEVVDCSEIKERNLLINKVPVCLDVEKGGVVESSFTIRRLAKGCSNCNFDKLGVDLAIFGMPNLLSFNKVYLESNEEKIIDYTIFVPKNARAGVHLLEIKGTELAQGVFDTSIGFVESQNICINVLGESDSKILVTTKSKDIIWCSSEIFELVIQNTGDFDETFNLSAFDLPIGVSVTFSEDEVFVKKGQTKTIYVSISTDPDSIIRDNQSVSIKLDGSVTLTTKIFFNIKDKPGFEELEFLSSTKLIKLETGQVKEYELLIRNNSNKTYRNVEVLFENLPSEVSVQKRIIDVILPGEIVKVSGNISAEDINGEFKPFFVLKTHNYINKQEFSLVVINNKPFSTGFTSQELNNVNQGNGLVGLFLLGNLEMGFGMSLFLILLLLSVIFLVIFAKLTENKNKKEIWVEGN